MSDFRGIISAINHHIELDEMEQALLITKLETRSLKAGEFVEKSGELSTRFIFINTGCLMSFSTDREGFEHVMQFATPSWWTGDLHSFTHHMPSQYSTRALAESEVFMISKTSLDTLLEKVPKLEKYFRILFQNALVAHQFRITQNLSASAEERYLGFNERYPTLEQFVPQKYIASYLGVTPEFLSKIRRRLMNK